MMSDKNNRSAAGRRSLYTGLALALVALGLIAGILAVSLSGCHATDQPAQDSADSGPAEDSMPAAESTPSSDSVESPDDSSAESVPHSSLPSEYSLPEESESDLPVIIDGQPKTTKKYEETIGLRYQIDMNAYEQYVNPEDPMEYVFLVNSTHKLSSDYVPSDLTDCIHTRKDGRNMQQLRLYAEKALEAFLAEGALCGVTNVTVTSAYRSYSYQNKLFNQYVDQHLSKYKTREECEKYVETFSARPGTSEHQSGLCCDMHNMGSAQQSFAKKPEAKWLAENCWRFGFILRYPEDKEDITKIIYEPWHFRFVGRVAATAMHESGMCLEEYCDSLGMKQ